MMGYSTLRGFRFSALALLACVGCKVNPTSPDLENTSEGKACPPEAKIEDAEDGNNQVLVQDGRSGYIYTFVDPAGSVVVPPGGAPFTVTPGGANGTQNALRIQGQLVNAQVVYAAMGMNFTDPVGPFDVSKYQGVSFYAKKGPGTTSKVRINFPDKNTDEAGGVCAHCSNHFGLNLKLTEEWQKFIVPFDALSQDGDWGNPRPRSLDTSAVFALHFHVNDKGKNFDVWVDEIAFTGCP